MRADPRTTSLVVEIPGRAIAVPLADFRATLDTSVELLRAVLASASALLRDAEVALVCGRHHTLRGRLASCLLLLDAYSAGAFRSPTNGSQPSWGRADHWSAPSSVTCRSVLWSACIADPSRSGSRRPSRTAPALAGPGRPVSRRPTPRGICTGTDRPIRCEAGRSSAAALGLRRSRPINFVPAPNITRYVAGQTTRARAVDARPIDRRGCLHPELNARPTGGIAICGNADGRGDRGLSRGL